MTRPLADMHRAALQDLPIAPLLDEICENLAGTQYLVIEAAPGAGKTTAIPIALAESAQFGQKILMLEPRRAATRNAALRIANLTNTKLGAYVGYRMRGDSVVTKSTKIEIVTDAILTRMIEDDPNLSDYSAIIFDEFHERHLNSDLGLALALEVTQALRDDLHLVVMSATLDAAPIAALLNDAPIIRSETRQFPIDIFWHDENLHTDTRALPALVADEIVKMSATHEGSILVFLPGRSEIERTARALFGKTDLLIETLYGQMPYAAQKAVIERNDVARRVVLATPIAESAITLADIRVVIDSGLTRRPEFDPRSGMSKLVTTRISKAEATQRAGRAGRVAKGVVLRLWRRAEDGIMSDQPPPEILHADLAPMALTLAAWGNPDGKDLKLLTAPPRLNFDDAKALLSDLGATTGLGITEWGKRLASTGLHPRLATILFHSEGATKILVEEHEFPAQTTVPLVIAILEDALSAPLATTALEPLVYDILRKRNVDKTLPPARLKRIFDNAKRYRLTSQREGQSDVSMSLGQLIAYGFPERIAALRPTKSGDYRLARGGGARLEVTTPPAFLVAPLLFGDRQNANIELYIELSRDEIIETFPKHIKTERCTEYLRNEGRIIGYDALNYHNLTLKSAPQKLTADDALIAAQIELIRDQGIAALDWSKRARQFQARAKRAAAIREIPRLDDEALIERAADWLAPFGLALTKKAQLSSISAYEILRNLLNYQDYMWLEQNLPESLHLPNGSRAAINYLDDLPQAELRLTDAYGLSFTPMLGGAPLRLVLLSPANRPLQTTSDLAGFWTSSYPEIRKEMRGRYPKHHWPEDPLGAAPRPKPPRRS